MLEVESGCLCDGKEIFPKNLMQPHTI